MPSTTTPTDPHTLEDRLVAELVATDPRRAVVFERLGIDYCCGGNVPLADACIEHGLDLAVVRDLLEQATATPSDERDWTQATVAELVEDIVTRHHGLLRTELPRLTVLAHKVARAHGAKHRPLIEAEAVVVQLGDELRAHTADEEDRIFPACLEAGSPTLDVEDATKLAEDLGKLVEEHTEAADHLVALRTLLDDYDPPAHACTSWRAYLDGLERLEQDMHRHVHKENHVLFPKVMNQLYAAGAPR